MEREKFTWTMTEEEKAECRARQADTLARAAAHMAEYDLVVLDEVLGAVNAGMLSLADVLRTVREKAPNTELVLTGRCLLYTSPGLEHFYEKNGCQKGLQSYVIEGGNSLKR